MKKIKQAFGGKKKDKDALSVSSKLSECGDTGYEVKGELPKLHVAAWSGSAQKVKTLLSSGKADVDEQDSEGRSALHLACARGHNEVCKELLSAGAKTNVEDRENKTPLRKAIECQSAGCVQHLVASKASVNTLDEKGDSALHYAVRTGNADIVRSVIAGGAKLDLKNREGLNPLLLAVTLKHDDVVAVLLEKGANVNTTTSKGRTSLMIACEQNAPTTVSILLRYKANIGAEDPKGQTAEDIALLIGHHDCAELIGRARDVRRSSIAAPSVREEDSSAAAGPAVGSASAAKKEDTKSVSSAGSLRKKSETPKLDKKASPARPEAAKLPPTPPAPAVPAKPASDDDWSDSESLSIGVKAPPARRNVPVPVPRVNSVEDIPITPDKAKPKEADKGNAKVADKDKNKKPISRKQPDSDNESDTTESESEKKSKKKPKGAPKGKKTGGDESDSDWDSTENDVSSLQNSPRKQPSNVASLVVLPEEEPAPAKSSARRSATAESTPSRKPPVATTPKTQKAVVITPSPDSESDSDFDAPADRAAPLVVGVGDNDDCDDFDDATIVKKPQQTPVKGADVSVAKSAANAAAQSAANDELTERVTALQEFLDSAKAQLKRETARNEELLVTIAAMKREGDDTHKQLESVKQAKVTVESEHADLKTAYRKLELDCREESLQRKNLEEELNRLKRSIEEKSSDREKDKAEKSAEQNELRKAKLESDYLKNKLNALETDKTALKSKAEQLSAENSRLLSALRDAESNLLTLKASAALDEAAERRSSQSQDVKNEMAAQKAALQVEMDQLRDRHQDELARMHVENGVLQAKLQQLEKELGGTKGALNDATVHLEEQRRLLAQRADSAAEAERRVDPAVQAQLVAMTNVVLERDTRIRDLMDEVASERRRREELELKSSQDSEKLRRVDAFVQQLFVTIKRHYRPSPHMQPLIDDVNRIVDQYNGGAPLEPLAASLPPTPARSSNYEQPKSRSEHRSQRPPTPTGSRNEIVEEPVVRQSDSRLRSTPPAFATQLQVSADSYSPMHAVDSSASVTNSTPAPYGSRSLYQNLDPASALRASLGNLLDAQHNEQLTVDGKAQLLPVVLTESDPMRSPNATRGPQNRHNEDTVKLAPELERLNASNVLLDASFGSQDDMREDQRRAQGTPTMQQPLAEHKIETLVSAIDKLQTDLKASTSSLDKIYKQSHNRKRSSRAHVRSGSGGRSASLPGGPRGILSKHPGTKRPRNLSFEDLANSSDESAHTESNEATESDSDDESTAALRSQNAALQSVKQQLSSALESMRREPENAMALAESVSGAAMPVVDSIAQQIAAQPAKAKEKVKRREQRKRMLGQIGDMLRDQTAHLGDQIEQLRSEAERKFVDRSELERRPLADSAPLQPRLDDEMELLNKYKEQQQRAKQDLDRKRLQCTIAAEQMHKDAKRELDSHMRQLREALSEVSSPQSSFTNEHRTPLLRQRSEAGGRDGVQDSRSAGYQVPLLNRSSSSRPPLPTSVRSSLASTTSSFGDALDFTRNSNLLRTDATLNKSTSSTFSPTATVSPRSSTLASLAWNEAMPSNLHSYREFIYNKRQI